MSLMLKMLLIALFVALFSSTCLSYSTGTSLWEPDTSAFTVRTASANLSYGDSFVVFTPGSTKEAEKEYGQIFSDPAPVDLTSQPLSALTWAIFAKISRGALNFSSNQQQNLNGLLEFSFRSGKDMLHAITEQSLWILVKVWCAIYFATIKIIWHFVHHFTMPTLALILLTCATMLVYRMVSWLCSKFPVFLITFPWTIMKYMITKRPKEVKEKACEGFVTFSIPQSPPRNSIVEISYQDGSHAGYATCVKLHNGHNGLLTAQHVCGSEDMAVHSLRNGQKIKLGLFKPLFSNAELDLALYMGPPSWESSLGCSGVDIVCAKRLALSDVRHFRFENEWRSYNGKVTGSNQRKATVLSNTRAGDSGSAYFNGKTVVGVHTGFPDSGENFNLMAPIPDIPGLTTSKLVFETTAPQGKIFDEDDLKYFEELLEDFGISEARSIMRARKGLESSTQNQGNRKAQHRLRNKRRSKHPKDKAREYYNLAASFHGNPISAPCEYISRSRGNDGKDPRGPGKQDKSGRHRKENNREGVYSSNEKQIPRDARWKQEASNFRKYFAEVYSWQVSTTPLQIPGFREVGATPQYYYAKQKEESLWGRRLAEQHPELASKTAGFGWPKFGPEAELKSLRLQASRWLDRAQTAKTPSDAQRQHVINRTVRAYSAAQTQTPSFCTKETLMWLEFLENFKMAINSLELDAGVGVPMIAYGLRTHRSWVENPELLPVLARMTFDRLQKISEANFEQMTPEELVREGLCDPIRLFVKGEPHKQSKLDEGRYRLIMSVSLLDQLVARVLFQSQNKLEIALWRAVPSKPGFGLSTDSQIEDFTDCLAKQVGVTPDEVVENWKDYLVPTDCSGFDWSVSDWLLEDDMEVRNRLTINCSPLLRRLRAGWLKCISNSVLCLSDGTLLAQTKPGVQKSGSYNTSSSNSRIRVMAAYHSGASWAMAMGDDALESKDTDLTVYKDLGFKVEVSEQLEFCSHIFKERSLAIPVNVNKMLYKLIHGYNPECGNAEVMVNYLSAVASVMNELRHDPILVSKLFEWLVPVQSQNN
ncbi:TPA_asm: P1-P2 fusion protein [Trachyspermum ammi polerovirus]|nr:TPA_asm: P1-P2 fusion protein [Trachyspermum ammi polerovirus]